MKQLITILLFSFSVGWACPIEARQGTNDHSVRTTGGIPAIQPGPLANRKSVEKVPAATRPSALEIHEIDSRQLQQIDGAVAAGIAAGNMPGCVVCIGSRDKIVLLKAYGNRQIVPEAEPMTTDTVFDLASLTKPVATATAIMILVERGDVRIDEHVADFFPEFGTHGKEQITIRDLLLHRSGLVADNPLADYQQGPEQAWKNICGLSLVDPVGTRFRYSDVNFVVLGHLVMKLAGVGLDEFVQAEILEPLGMKESGFNPPDSLQARTAPTEQRDGDWLRGTVHDPRAFELGGVAGHAGLFSTASDLARYARMMLNGGATDDGSGTAGRVLSLASVQVMTAGYRSGEALRGLGWDKRSVYSSNRGDLLSDSAFGHGGFTGTVLWVDPELDLFVIFLSSRLHPDGKGSVNGIAGKIVNIAAGSVVDRSEKTASPVPVLAGIDVLQRDGFRQLAGRRVGLITNQTGRSREGVSTARLLSTAENLKLVTLFSPEHGFAGQLDTEIVADAIDEETGVRVFSLYGENRRPTAEMLRETETLVFDVQDVGTRFYTYVSTMGEAMVAADEAGCQFVVLDRPNPVNGVDVSGPMLDAGSESFVGWHSLPVRHGMTVGELAKMICAERKLKLDLQVIPCEGWQRKDRWEQTGLVWVPPSPNIRSVTQALLYPGTGLLEMTNLSVGRGTDTPFEIVGAPWMDHVEVANRLARMELKGVGFVPVEFQPTASRHAGESCRGINVVVTDRNLFSPVETGLAIAWVLRQVHPTEWKTDNLNRLLGSDRVVQRLGDGSKWQQVLEASRDGVGDFLARRQKYLLYR